MTKQTLISGCLLYDGSDASPLPRDVRITNGVITNIGALTPEAGETIIDARGLALMPGIIHVASHIDTLGGVADLSLERAYAASGATTVVLGLGGYSSSPYENASNAGISAQLAPRNKRQGGWTSVGAMFEDLSRREHAINLASFVGANTLLAHSSPTQALGESLAAGAIGCSFSAGDPFIVGSPEYRLARATAHVGKPVAFRPSYAPTLAREFEHALHFANTYHTTTFADDVALPAHTPPSTLQALATTLASTAGKCYAFVRSGLSRHFPIPSFSRAHAQLVDRFSREALSSDELVHVDTAYADFLAWTGESTLNATQKYSSLLSRSVNDIAHEWGMSPSSALALLSYRHNGGIAIESSSAPQAASLIREADAALPRHAYIPLHHIWSSVHTNDADRDFRQHFVGSDTNTDRAHIIAKLTSIPASLLGLSHRGRIARGHYADLILFDPKKLSSSSHDHVITRVFINGECLYEDASYRQTNPGRVLTVS